MEDRFTPKCRFCFSKNVVKWTRRKILSGWKQRWLCKGCGRTFTADDGFLWKHHSPLIITETLSLYIRGMSESDVSDHLWQHHHIRISTGTVNRWIREYSPILVRFTDTFAPRIVGNIHTDEVIIRVGKGKEWRWGAIDSKTKYKISGNLTKRRSYEKGAKPLYHKMKHKCKGRPPRIVSDKLPHYKRSFNKYYHNTDTKMVHGVPIACRKHGLKYNNNPAERDNERVKQRTKVMRGFKSHESAEDFLNLLDIHHNYIKPSTALGGSYPAEEAEIHLSLGRNRLYSMILKASY